jgi:class 3 adenylate cyclase
MGASDNGSEGRRPSSGDGDGGRIHLGREPSIRLGALLIQPGLRRIAHDDGREAFVEPRVMQVLIALARSPSAMLSRDELVEACWHGVVVGEDAITRVIGRLRRLAEGIGKGQFDIETHIKVGYRLMPLGWAPEPRTSEPTSGERAAASTPAPSGPIALHGERRYVYSLVSDLDGFTELTRDTPPEVAADVINAYLGALSRTVLEHGGMVDKTVGDCVVAFWGAPVARPDDGERAAAAAIAMWRIGESFHARPANNHPPLGHTSIGLHRGNAIVGNFDAGGRLTYQAMGDAVRMAFAVEGANRPLNTRVLASRPAICPSMKGAFRAMGRIGIQRRLADPLEVFEAAPSFPPDATERLNDAYARFDGGEIEALDEISALAAEFPDDLALGNLLARLEAVGPGGVFRLG